MTQKAHFFERRDSWGHSTALWVLVTMVALIPPAWCSVRQIDLENNVENWLPADDPEAQLLDWYRHHFDDQDRLLVTWNGSSLSDPRVGELAERLLGVPDDAGIRRHGLPQIASVVTPEAIIGRMIEHGVSRDEAVGRLTGTLVGTGQLKVRLTRSGRFRKQQTIRSFLRLAKSQFGLDVEVIEPGPAAATAVESVGGDGGTAASEPEDVEFAVVFDEPAHDFEIGWSGMHVNPQQKIRIERLLLGMRGRKTKAAPDGEPLVADVFLQPGSPVALSVALSESGSADPAGTFLAIRLAAESVGVDPDALHMGGRSVAGSALNQSVKKAAWNREVPVIQLHRRSVLLMSLLVGSAAAFLMLRSVRLTLLVLVTAVYATFLTVALVPATHGSMNMVLVVMPTLLSVLTISAGIHVANYWRHAAAINARTAVVETFKMAKLPCTLASVTTAIGLISLATSSLTPVRDFGIYSAIGCLISLVVVLFGLPALLQVLPARRQAQLPEDRRGWLHFAKILTRHPYVVTVACIAVLVSCSYGLRWFRTETKVIRYFPDNSQLVQDYQFLERNLCGIVPLDTVIRFDEDSQNRLNYLERLEIVREVEYRMRRHPEISGAISLADFQPQTEMPDADASFLINARFNRKARAIEQRVRNGESQGTSSFLTVSGGSDQMVDADGRPISRPGDELWRISAQASILSDMNYAQLTRDLDQIAQGVLRYHAGSDHLVTGMVPFFLRTQQAVLDSLIRSFCLAFVVIAIVMMVLLKNPIAGLITMLPNVLPIGTVFGLIAWYGMPVDIGTMITASVALGIAVDGTLHLLTWFRYGLAAGLSRRSATAQALAHCGPAMWQTSAAVGLGLLMLAPANLLLVSRFGWLMAALIGVALLADIVFLPVLMAGPLGRLMERTVKADAKATTDEGEDETRRHDSGSQAKPKLKVVTASSTGHILRLD